MAIYIDVDRPYPSSIEVYSNELNKGGSKIVEVAFYSKNIPVDLTDVTVTAAFAIDKYLVAEDVTVTKETDNVCSVDISSTDDYQMFPGNLYVEFKFTKQDEEFYPSTVLVVKILPSIRMQSEITPQSYGTVAEILQEVARAKGDFTDLPSRLDDIDDRIENYEIPDGSVTTPKLEGKAVTGEKIATGTIQSSNIGTGQVQAGNIDGGAVTNDKLAKDSVSAEKIQGGAVTFGKLGADVQTAINNKLPYQRLLKNTGGVPTALQVEDLNSLNLDHYTFYYIWLAYGFLYPTQPREWAVILELESNNQFIITKNGEIYFREKVSGVWSNFINTLGNLLKTTDYSIGFNADGMAVKKTINTALNIGEFGAETIKVYVSGQVTRIGDNFFDTATKVTDIYIDNTEGKVELPTIPERVTIHYKDEFKLSDLIVDSMVASNTKLLNLENTFSGLINGDEVAY